MGIKLHGDKVGIKLHGDKVPKAPVAGWPAPCFSTTKHDVILQETHTPYSIWCCLLYLSGLERGGWKGREKNNGRGVDIWSCIMGCMNRPVGSFWARTRKLALHKMLCLLLIYKNFFKVQSLKPTQWNVDKQNANSTCIQSMERKMQKRTHTERTLTMTSTTITTQTR